ncbi:MAG TPA: aminotransferase class III-fold pyridoxal phosphate-dependent enzyme [Polyangia bacterium]|nr:aminotransferase class III-fold pyridoxal phosphate-dependent enzyme [Polyangia bacterium]
MSALSDEQAARVFTTWTAQRDATFLEIVGGQGARFTTADGARWWDLGSMTWNAGLGHGHPRMQKALAEAAARGLLVYPTAVFPAKARAAELLAEVTPKGLEKTFFCLSGAEANENAVKMARLVTGRKKVVARTRSYHGATLAMLSLSGDPRREPFEPGLPGVVRMGDPYCFRCPFGKEPTSCAHECAQDLETVLRREGPDTVAAVILEGIVGANGVFVPPPGYWRKIREICDRHGVLLIADEVLSGFGRTGRWFAVDHDGVTPDLMTMAKGLTGGYVPGGAVIVSERIARHFDDHVLVCGLTSYAHPLVCEAVVATIETMRDEKLVERAAARGDFLRGRLADFARPRPHLAEVRGLGLLWAFELCVPGPDGARTKLPLPPPVMAKLSASLRRHHLHMHKRDNLLYFAPPLVIGEAELEAALAELGRALDEALL